MDSWTIILFISALSIEIKVIRRIFISVYVCFGVYSVLSATRKPTSGKIIVKIFWQRCYVGHLFKLINILVFFTFHLGIQPVPLQTITNENPAGPSLGTVPQARFLLVMLNMLTLQHGANTLNLLLNSGMLALMQTTLRLIGICRSVFLWLFPPLLRT